MMKDPSYTTFKLPATCRTSLKSSAILSNPGYLSEVLQYHKILTTTTMIET